MSSFICLGPTRFLVLAIASFAASAAAQETERQVVNPVDETQRVHLSGNTRPEAIPENDRGPVDDNLRLEHMQMLLRRPAALQHELDTYTERLSDKSSPNFHHWLTPDELRPALRRRLRKTSMPSRRGLRSTDSMSIRFIRIT